MTPGYWKRRGRFFLRHVQRKSQRMSCHRHSPCHPAVRLGVGSKKLTGSAESDTSNTLKTVILGPFCPKDRAAAQVPRAECRNKTALPGIIIIKQHIRLYVPAALPVPGQVSVPS